MTTTPSTSTSPATDSPSPSSPPTTPTAPPTATSSSTTTSTSTSTSTSTGAAHNETSGHRLMMPTLSSATVLTSADALRRERSSGHRRGRAGAPEGGAPPPPPPTMQRADAHADGDYGSAAVDGSGGGDVNRSVSLPSMAGNATTILGASPSCSTISSTATTTTTATTSTSIGTSRSQSSGGLAGLCESPPIGDSAMIPSCHGVGLGSTVHVLLLVPNKAKDTHSPTDSWCCRVRPPTETRRMLHSRSPSTLNPALLRRVSSSPSRSVSKDPAEPRNPPGSSSARLVPQQFGSFTASLSSSAAKLSGAGADLSSGALKLIGAGSHTPAPVPETRVAEKEIPGIFTIQKSDDVTILRSGVGDWRDGEQVVRLSVNKTWRTCLGFYKRGPSILFGSSVEPDSGEADIILHQQSHPGEECVVSLRSAMFVDTWVSFRVDTDGAIRTTTTPAEAALFYVEPSKTGKRETKAAADSLNQVSAWLVPSLLKTHINPTQSVILKTLRAIAPKWNHPLSLYLQNVPHFLSTDEKMQEECLWIYCLEFLELQPGLSFLQVNLGCGQTAHLACDILAANDAQPSFYTGWDTSSMLEPLLQYVHRHRHARAGHIAVSVQNTYTFSNKYKAKYDRVLLCGRVSQGRFHQMTTLLRPRGLMMACFDTLAGPNLFLVRKSLEGEISRDVIPVPDFIRLSAVLVFPEPSLVFEINDRISHFHGDLTDEEELKQWLCYFGDAYGMDLSTYSTKLIQEGFTLPLIKEGGLSLDDLLRINIPQSDISGLACALTKYSEFIARKAESALNEIKKKAVNIEVSIKKFNLDIVRVDAVQSEFEVHLQFVITYHDDACWRAFMTKKPTDEDRKLIALTDLSVLPNFSFPNSRGTVETLGQNAWIYPKTGTIEVSTLFSGIFFEIMELQRFPFDRQLLHIYLMHDKDNQHNVTLKWKETQNTDMKLVTNDREWKEAHPSIAFPTGTETKLALLGRVERLSTYFMWNVVFVMLLIVSMSFIAWCLDPTEGGDRLGINLTLLLTAVAYKYVIGAYLPKTAYLTILDYYILSAFVLLIIIIVENGIAAAVSEPTNAELDKWSEIILIPVWMLLNIVIVAGSIFGFFNQSWEAVDASQDETAPPEQRAAELAEEMELKEHDD
ncbi:hypothetical protein Pelo_14066 [Pelomyxa schiedti]|nr:hypothetical protein Pelo_14066 [Pelomyxa schiedti]